MKTYLLQSLALANQLPLRRLQSVLFWFYRVSIALYKNPTFTFTFTFSCYYGYIRILGLSHSERSMLLLQAVNRPFE